MNENIDKTISEGPRKRLELYGQNSLSDKELVMILLGQGSTNHPVEEVSTAVLNALDTIKEPNLNDLRYIPGMGSYKASTIIASLELGRRKCKKKKRTIKTPQDVYNAVKHYGDREQEHLIVISLNGAREIIGEQVVTIGTMDKTLIHPREVFATPLKERAAAIVIAHNHPSGNIEPSSDDKKATKRIVDSGEILGIKVVDHIVFSLDSYYSFLEHGLLG